ncbi:MAG: prealbumin-like fold domain-containing protein, partial [Planctomycetota bacterium]
VNFQLDDDGNNANTLPNSMEFEVEPGSGYEVAENSIPEGWKLSDANSDNDRPVDDISVAEDEIVTCTFTNKKLGLITLIKNALGDDGTFNFLMTGSPLASSTQLTTEGGTAEQTFTDIDPDETYSIQENPVPEGWNLTGVYCENETVTGSTTSRDHTGFSITNGGTVTCAFTNEVADLWLH